MSGPWSPAGAREWTAAVWDWGAANMERSIAPRLLEHLQLSYASILLGLVIALPVGLACARWRLLYPPVLTGVNVLYSIPSIALFFLMLPYTGFGAWTAIVPLALYTLAILVPNVVGGLHQVPGHVRQAAVAMGFGPVRRLLQVEFPVAVPVIIAGLRVASVATISMVSIASLVGLGGLGQLILSEGFRRQFHAPIVVGILLTVALAFLTDVLLVLAQRVLTPWTRTARPAPRPSAAARRGGHAPTAAAEGTAGPGGAGAAEPAGPAGRPGARQGRAR